MLRARLISCVVALCVGSATASARAAETATRTLTVAGEHPFVVPAAVTTLHLTLVGGNGGAGAGADGGAGGLPASVSATLAVSPGETLYAEVAGNGGAATAPDAAIGGYGGGAGGGEGVFFGTSPSGGGGGGASDIRTCSASAPGCSTLASRLVVAGGGAGGGGPGLVKTTPIFGGAGGAAEFPGSNGASDGSDTIGGGGGGATPGAAGAGGSDGGEGGALGLGGIPPDSGIVGGAGGGGGGGLFGGGGGGAGAGHVVGGSEGFGSGGGGGGGGSSGVPAGASGVSAFAKLATTLGAQPGVTISWTMPPPASLTGTPTALTSSSATLTGTVNPDGSQLSDCHFTISPATATGNSIPCSQQIGAGEAPVTVTAAAAGLQPSTTYTVALSASSAQGTSSGAALTFTTAATALPGSTGPREALTVSSLKLGPARFRRGKHAAKLARAKPRSLPTATTISFTLSRAAAVALSFERAQPGVLAGHKCVARRAHSKGRACTRYVTSGVVSRAGHSGVDRIRFEGVLDHGKPLAPGIYRISLTARAGSATTTAAQRPTFTLLP